MTLVYLCTFNCFVGCNGNQCDIQYRIIILGFSKLFITVYKNPENFRLDLLTKSNGMRIFQSYLTEFKYALETTNTVAHISSDIFDNNNIREIIIKLALDFRRYVQNNVKQN